MRNGQLLPLCWFRRRDGDTLSCAAEDGLDELVLSVSDADASLPLVISTSIRYDRLRHVDQIESVVA